MPAGYGGGGRGGERFGGGLIAARAGRRFGPGAGRSFGGFRGPVRTAAPDDA
ncbi:hypothetical protein GCM10010394_17850 [Streptomyces crystallinus]|uniref:Uncharacterized protein n=1 Tax=Streptomyces crystallinus TaxID=68191 RepID=A0ABN1FE47_9ACTN